MSEKEERDGQEIREHLAAVELNHGERWIIQRGARARAQIFAQRKHIRVRTLMRQVSRMPFDRIVYASYNSFDYVNIRHSKQGSSRWDRCNCRDTSSRLAIIIESISVYCGWFTLIPRRAIIYSSFVQVWIYFSFHLSLRTPTFRLVGMRDGISTLVRLYIAPSVEIYILCVRN